MTHLLYFAIYFLSSSCFVACFRTSQRLMSTLGRNWDAPLTLLLGAHLYVGIDRQTDRQTLACAVQGFELTGHSTELLWEGTMPEHNAVPLSMFHCCVVHVPCMLHPGLDKGSLSGVQLPLYPFVLNQHSNCPHCSASSACILTPLLVLHLLSC